MELTDKRKAELLRIIESELFTPSDRIINIVDNFPMESYFLKSELSLLNSLKLTNDYLVIIMILVDKLTDKGIRDEKTMLKFVELHNFLLERGMLHL